MGQITKWAKGVDKMGDNAGNADRNTS